MESSPFHQLPGEIRNRIYELALYHPQDITIRVLTGIPRLVDPEQRNMLALSTTCTQIRNESSSLLYEINKFTLIARPSGQRYTEQIWQKGLRAWLLGIGEGNRKSLADVEINIGTSFMYDLHPSSESLWRSVSTLLPLFNRSVTRVKMKTDVNWMSRSSKTFPLTIPLTDVKSAYVTLQEILTQQRLELERWCQATRVGAREVSYRRMELETLGQELRSFINLLETANNSRLD